MAQATSRKDKKRKPRLNRSAEAVENEVAPPRPLHPVLVFAFYPALLAATLLFLCIRPILDPDCWFHMAFGRYVLQNRAFPPGDVFSFTAAGNEWISSGWLTSVLMQLAYATGGGLGLALLVYGMITAAFLVAYYWGVRRFAAPTTLTTVLLVAMLASYLRFSPRPENASYVFLAVTLALLGWSSTDLPDGRWRKSMWALPVVIAAWANFHAGFIVGLVTIGIFILFHFHALEKTKSREHLSLILPAAVALGAWLLNPYGYRVFALAGKIKSMPGVKENIYEWMPLFSTIGIPFPWPAKLGYVLVLGLCAGIAAFSWRRLTPWQWLTFIFFAALPFYERRHVGLSALALPIVIAPRMIAVERILPRFAMLLPLSAAIAVLLIVKHPQAGIFSPGEKMLSAPVSDQLLPKTAVEFIKANPPPQNFYNPYGPGGYILYHLGPETKVFIDGRLDVYNRETWMDYQHLDAGRMPVQAAAEKYNFNSMLIFVQGHSTNPDHLVIRVNSNPDWKLVYFDDSYALYVRNTPENESYLRKHAYRHANPIAAAVQEAFAGGPQARQLLHQEIERALKESNGSAKAHIIAALTARADGNETLAQQHLHEAQKRNPMIRLGSR